MGYFGGGGSPNSTTASAVIPDNQIVRGDGGVRGVQGSALTLADFNGDITGPTSVSNTSAVGGGFTNQPNGDAVIVKSSNAGDTTQQATIIYEEGGVVNIQNIALSGTTGVPSSSSNISRLLALVLNSVCAGTVTVTDGSLNTITTITTGNLSAGLFNFTATNAYGRKVNIVASTSSVKHIGIGGFDTSGATQRTLLTLAGASLVQSSTLFGNISQLYIGDVENTVTVTVSTGGGINFLSEILPTQRVMVPMGEVSYFSVSGTAVTISAQSDGSTNMVVVPVVTTGNFDNDPACACPAQFDNGGSNNGRLRYIGATTRTFHIALSWSAQAATGGDVFVLGVAKTGAVVASSKVINTLAGVTIQGSAIHLQTQMATNDYLELYVGNLTAGRNITVMTLNLFAMGM